MKISRPTLILLFCLGLTACDSRGGSALLGGVAGAGGYEFHLKKQRDRIEADYRDGNIDKEEYDIRIDQVNRDSLLR